MSFRGRMERGCPGENLWTDKEKRLTWHIHKERQSAVVVEVIPLCLALATCVTGPARAAIYVVDQAAPGAADTNPGTEEKPFKTVRHAADVVKPGDTVLVMAGRYDERVRVRTSGADGQPITFRRCPGARPSWADSTSRPVTSASRASRSRPRSRPWRCSWRGSHCEVLDNYIHDMMVGVAGTVGKLSPDGNTRDYSAVAHNRIAYNKVYHSQYGFMLGGDDWLVENNEVNRLFMYAPGNKNDDCDYSRFFGKGCVERYNYYHGSTSSEIRVAHVDCLQTFTVNGEIAQDLLFEYNTCFDFHQMCMVESAPHIGSVRGWTFRGNIVSANSPTMSGGWGPDIIQTPDVTIANNTISTVRWAAIGLRGKESTNGQIRNNILCDAERAVDRRRPGFLSRQAGDRVQPDVQDLAPLPARRTSTARTRSSWMRPNGISGCRRAARRSARARAE